VQQAVDGELVKRPKRLLRVLPLPRSMPRGEHQQGELEELFVDELARLQPTAGFMRLVKERVLHAWRDLKADAKQRILEVERKQKAIQQKLDRLDEAFLYERTIGHRDVRPTSRQAPRGAHARADGPTRHRARRH